MFSSINTDKLVKDHSDMVDAFEAHDKEKAYEISLCHTKRYMEHLDEFLVKYPNYFKKWQKTKFFSKSVDNVFV